MATNVVLRNEYINKQTWYEQVMKHVMSMLYTLGQQVMDVTLGMAFPMSHLRLR
jgi:hypothetical protein